MQILPHQSSPVEGMIQTFHSWKTKENSTIKAEFVARLVSLVAGSVLSILSVAYHASSAVVKLPFVFVRLTFGQIPLPNGKVADNFPQGLTCTDVLMHAYKVMVFALDIIIFPVVGSMNPDWLYRMHLYIKVIEIDSGSKTPTPRPISGFVKNPTYDPKSITQAQIPKDIKDKIEEKLKQRRKRISDDNDVTSDSLPVPKDSNEESITEWNKNSTPPVKRSEKLQKFMKGIRPPGKFDIAALHQQITNAVDNHAEEVDHQIAEKVEKNRDDKIKEIKQDRGIADNDLVNDMIKRSQMMDDDDPIDQDDQDGDGWDDDDDNWL